MRTTMMVVALAVATLVAAPASAQVRVLYDAPSGEHGTRVIDQSRHHLDARRLGGVTRRHGAYVFHRFDADHQFDRIIRPDAPALNPGRLRFTYGLRLKVSPTAVWQNTEMAVIRHGDSDAPGGDYKMELRKLASGTVVVKCSIHDDDGSGHGFAQGHPGVPSLNDGQWHQVTCARADATHTSLTIDGHTTTSANRGSLGNVTGDVPLLIGCQFKNPPHRGFREQFVGRMDNIKVAVQR